MINTSLSDDGFVSYVDIKECSRRGVSLEARSVTFCAFDADSSMMDDSDKYELSDLRHPYQSLPTSFTGMAFKIFQGTPLRPACVELKSKSCKDHSRS